MDTIYRNILRRLFLDGKQRDLLDMLIFYLFITFKDLCLTVRFHLSSF